MFVSEYYLLYFVIRGVILLIGVFGDKVSTNMMLHYPNVMYCRFLMDIAQFGKYNFLFLVFVCSKIPSSSCKSPSVGDTSLTLKYTEGFPLLVTIPGGLQISLKFPYFRSLLSGFPKKSLNR